jgi:hypothetical protein
MWLSEDGVVNTASIPFVNLPNSEELASALSGLTENQTELLDSKLLDIMWEIADLTDAIKFTTEEKKFVGASPPSEVFRDLDWAELIGPNATKAFERIDLRWRLDVLNALQQSVADLAN